MAATQSLMTLSSATVRPAENPILMGDSPANTEDAGALFAALMREAEPPAADSAGSAGDSAGAPTGNDLPGLPPRFAARGYQPEPVVADSKLEEFAVTMGIDRSLARLLLSETTNDSVVVDVADVDVVVDEDVTVVDATNTDTALERTTVEAISMAIPPSLPPPSPLLPALLSGESAARATQDESVPSAAVTPIADEDLLRWRAFGFRGMTEPTTPDAPSAESPAVESPSVANPAADTVALPTGVPVKKDLGMGRLLSLTMPARSADSLAEPSNTAGNTSLQVAMTPGMTSVTVSALSPLSAEEAKTRDTTRTATTVSELRSRAFNVSDVESTDREADEFSQEGETPSDADRWDTQSFVAALTPRGIAGGSEQGSSLSVVAGPAAGSATPPSAELAASMNAAVIRPEAMVELPSRFRELASTSTTHLPVPDPKMTAEDRSRTFAEAVAQRVIGQIRNENWSVSLQLEPLNLGSMDIDLALRGTEVTATVGVANAEVRSMLEAGLPRLREALESSGLQLAGWSFGQSGQRARGDSSSTPYIAQAYRERADEAAIVTDVSNMAALRRGSDSSRAVDLFV